MSERCSGSYAKSAFGGSSRRSTWREQRHKRHEDRDCEREEEQSGLGEGSYQKHQTVSGVLGHGKFDERDEELEHLHRLVRDLELETKGVRWRRDQDDQEEGFTSGGGHYKVGSHQFGPDRHRERSRSREYADQDLTSPEKRQPRNAAMDAMSRALRRVARSPFSDDIEWAPMLRRFTCPPFNSYDGKTNPIEHVSHYIQMMSLHIHNDMLMCKVFPSSLGPTTLRWFNGSRKGSIHSFTKLIQEFGV